MLRNWTSLRRASELVRSVRGTWRLGLCAGRGAVANADVRCLPERAAMDGVGAGWSARPAPWRPSRARRLWRSATLAALVCASPISAPSREKAPGELVRVERYASEESARIVLHLSGPVSFEKGLTPDPAGALPRLFVDLADTAYAGPPSYPMHGVVERVRLLQTGPALRVALDLGAPAHHDVFYLPSPFRVVIDVAVPRPRPALVARGPRRVERVALDPGHGGSDPGAVGASGVSEKDIALDIAHRAAPLLARELGISTLLTRDRDVRVPLEERVARANAFNADLFISIHCNADPTRSARGVMTFVLDRARDRRALAAALRENAAPDPGAAELSSFAGQFGDTAAQVHSERFARLLQRATLASLVAGYADAIDGGVHGAGFYVLAGARMPAVLFETAFISNHREERVLTSSRYRQKFADGIVNAVRAYRAGY